MANYNRSQLPLVVRAPRIPNPRPTTVFEFYPERNSSQHRLNGRIEWARSNNPPLRVESDAVYTFIKHNDGRDILASIFWGPDGDLVTIPFPDGTFLHRRNLIRRENVS